MAPFTTCFFWLVFPIPAKQLPFLLTLARHIMPFMPFFGPSGIWFLFRKSISFLRCVQMNGILKEKRPGKVYHFGPIFCFWLCSGLMVPTSPGPDICYDNSAPSLCPILTFQPFWPRSGAENGKMAVGISLAHTNWLGQPTIFFLGPENPVLPWYYGCYHIITKHFSWKFGAPTFHPARGTRAWKNGPFCKFGVFGQN